MNMVMRFKKLLLILILSLAAILRFWELDSYPALNADEAAIGYNAYSLIQTGQDEHGNSWPIHFQSFNDYKPGLYFYLVLPFVKIFGLNEWSVRIPGAFLGVATIFVLYLLIEELKIGNSIVIKNLKLGISEIAALLLAISPWHIHFSRGGWEVNVATFLIVLGLWLFLKGLNNKVFLFLSSLVFLLSLYAYHATRIVIPLLGIGILFIYRESVEKNLKNFLLAGLIGLVAILPLVKDFTKSDVASRAAGVGLFADPGPLSRINEQRGEHGDFTSFSAKVLHNKAVNYTLAFLKNWSDHFHGEFLFLSGDVIQRNRVPEVGQMYLQDFILLIVGMAAMVKWLKRKEIQLVLLWLLVAPTAAAFTFQSPHALRAQNMIIPLIIISAAGMVKIVEWLNCLSKYDLKLFGYLIISLFIIWNFARYEHMYWVHMAKEYPFSSQYGVKELVKYVEENQNKYEKIIVTDRYDQPYILFLFYLKYSPEYFQQDHVLTPRDKFGFSTVRNFDKYVFKSIVWDVDQPENPNSLIIGTDEEIPNEANIVKEIYGSNEYKYFEVVAN